MAKRRIVWTVQERLAIIEKAVELLRHYPKMPIFHAVGQVQQTLLPAARQRKWLTKVTLGDMVKDIQAELNKPVPKPVVMNTRPADPGDLTKALRIADEFCQDIKDYQLQCVAWRAVVCGYIIGFGAAHDKP